MGRGDQLFHSIKKTEDRKKIQSAKRIKTMAEHQMGRDSKWDGCHTRPIKEIQSIGMPCEVNFSGTRGQVHCPSPYKAL